MVRCSERISLSPFRETYCMLPKGHVGPHDSGLTPDNQRCKSVNSQQVQCGRPKGHSGSHSNGLLTSRSWS